MLLDSLTHLSDVRLATVVHVNPTDEDVVARYAELGAQRIVFVCADPDSLNVLRRVGRDHTELEVIEAAVAPCPGEAQWLRFNVRELNGLLPAGEALRSFYPRLKMIESLPVIATTLQGVLEQVSLDQPGQNAHNLLVLESPGLNAALLEGLKPECLGLFGLVFYRGARPGLYDDAGEAAVSQWLLDRFYRSAVHIDGADPLWCESLMRFDAVAAERSVMITQLGELQAQLGASKREHALAIAELDKARDEQARVAQEQLAQIEQLTKAKVKAEAGLSERDILIQDLNRRAAEVEAGVRAADKARQDIQQRHDALTQALRQADSRIFSADAYAKQLELQVAEQYRRQTQVDDELAHLEGQLELVKLLLAPALRLSDPA